MIEWKKSKVQFCQCGNEQRVQHTQDTLQHHDS